VLRRKFGPKRDEVVGELRKLHKEEDEMTRASSLNWTDPDIISL
jgi:hypothetical protein